MRPSSWPRCRLCPAVGRRGTTASTLSAAGFPPTASLSPFSLGWKSGEGQGNSVGSPESKLQSCPVHPPSPLHDLEDSATLAGGRYIPRLCPPCHPRKVGPGLLPHFSMKKLKT